MIYFQLVKFLYINFKTEFVTKTTSKMFTIYAEWSCQLIAKFGVAT